MLSIDGTGAVVRQSRCCRSTDRVLSFNRAGAVDRRSRCCRSTEPVLSIDGSGAVAAAVLSVLSVLSVFRETPLDQPMRGIDAYSLTTFKLT